MQIAIIEDDPDFADILKESLIDSGGCEVVDLLDNEEDALAFIKSGDLQRIDGVLVDLHLPISRTNRTINNSAGLRLASAIRHADSFRGMIIILTNSRSLNDGERALAAGCDGYLCKHARSQDIAVMVSEIKSAIEGDVMLFSREMRHAFVRDEISAKEACIMSMLASGRSWSEIARKLDYKNAKAAANIADRIYGKLLADDPNASEHCESKKRERALEIWRNRYPAKDLAL
jgi:DNA-binding NarL/FixJ family response regulator